MGQDIEGGEGGMRQAMLRSCVCVQCYCKNKISGGLIMLKTCVGRWEIESSNLKIKWIHHSSILSPNIMLARAGN